MLPAQVLHHLLHDHPTPLSLVRFRTLLLLHNRVATASFLFPWRDTTVPPDACTDSNLTVIPSDATIDEANDDPPAACAGSASSATASSAYRVHAWHVWHHRKVCATGRGTRREMVKGWGSMAPLPVLRGESDEQWSRDPACMYDRGVVTSVFP